MFIFSFIPVKKKPQKNRLLISVSDFVLDPFSLVGKRAGLEQTVAHSQDPVDTQGHLSTHCCSTCTGSTCRKNTGQMPCPFIPCSPFLPNNKNALENNRCGIFVNMVVLIPPSLHNSIYYENGNLNCQHFKTKIVMC